MTPAEGGSVVVYDPADPRLRSDPYPILDRIREETPVSRGADGQWVFARYDDCDAILRGPGWSSDPSTSSEEVAAMRRRGVEGERPSSFLFMDPPDHTRLRGLVAKAFTPRVVEQLRPRIAQIVDELLDEAAGRGEVDIIDALAFPLPAIVIAELLGVPAEDRDEFRGWSTDSGRLLDPPDTLPAEFLQQAMQSGMALIEYFQKLIADHRAKPGDDLLSALIAVQERGDQLTDAELLSTCTLLLVAGHETTVNLIGNGALALARHPEAAAALRADPGLGRSLVEEVLRYDPPVQTNGRIAAEDVGVGGVTVRRGESVTLLVNAANRDPAHFPEPGRFAPSRTDNRHLTFGGGIHFCIGAPLARVEGQIALTKLVQRFGSLDLLEDPPPYRPHLVLRGLASLRVRCAA